MATPFNSGSERLHPETPTHSLPSGTDQADITPSSEQLKLQAEAAVVSIGSLALDSVTNNTHAALKLAADQLRNLSRAQARLWQQIPYWDLMSQGITGYNDDVSYRQNIWPINRMRKGGWFGPGVRCYDGELIYVVKPTVLLPDEEVLGISFNELDARNILSSLVNKAIQPLPDYASKSAEALTVWRAKQLHRYNVAKPEHTS